MPPSNSADPDPTEAANATARSTSERRALLALRLGLGTIWAMNLVFILAPANQFFPTFAAAAGSYGPYTLGGGAFAAFVAAHPMVFAVLIAAVTAYLAVALLAGFTMRLALVVGAGFNLALLLTQYGQTFYFPGGTDVGPQPIYLMIYLVLAIGDASGSYSVDAWLARHLSGVPSAVFGWVGTAARRRSAPGA